MEDHVILVFEDGSDMMSFLEVARTTVRGDSDAPIKIGGPRPMNHSRLGTASPTSFEVIVFAVNVLSAAGTLVGLYLSRYGRKNITLVHTRTEKRITISGLTGQEAAAVLEAAASDVMKLDAQPGNNPAGLRSGEAGE